jgi:hypothetical protein
MQNSQYLKSMVGKGFLHMYTYHDSPCRSRSHGSFMQACSLAICSKLFENSNSYEDINKENKKTHVRFEVFTAVQSSSVTLTNRKPK